ncbi:uncharacterized protein HaLaN_18324 [Haematococcus lacustris]|uniref:Uncharacterized protein n=1 Tax=Haematococcus lacustris TaxID=44745 RepID=A0A699ZRP7_HAELA|nr:uncharacterized protein HaLaN_18324 [Haematococcus lacustris]
MISSRSSVMCGRNSYTKLAGGGGNPFDMKNLMESVKKAQQLVQVETQRVQQELANLARLQLHLQLRSS